MSDPEERTEGSANPEGDDSRAGEDAEGRPAIATDAPGPEPVSRRHRWGRIAAGAAIGTIAAAMLAGAFASHDSSREHELQLWTCQSFDGGLPLCWLAREADGHWIRPPPRPPGE